MSSFENGSRWNQEYWIMTIRIHQQVIVVTSVSEIKSFINW